LAFGAHPDDIEFGCGAIIARETATGACAHFVVCSRGEAGSRGHPRQRVVETRLAAKCLGATVEFVRLDGDARFEARPAHARSLAAVIRRFRPAVILAPTPTPNQHPDHAILGRLVRDAARLARYAGIAELRSLPPHIIAQLYFYAVTVEGEPAGVAPILVDVSDPRVISAWRAAMDAHVSQAAVRRYAELELTRARVFGLRAGRDYAMALFPNDPLLVTQSLADLGGARHF
jgi:LmbE family N-acetylglucosaminyl deacetylase